jgi:hypothetical protein
MRTLFTTRMIVTIALLLMALPALGEPNRDGPIVGHSEGNHRLDCTIVRPWEGDGGPTKEELPENGYFPIGWANGWGQGNVQGANQVENYMSGLNYWAKEGGFLVIAANQWSARSPDVLQCLQWLIDQNQVKGSDYEGVVNSSRIGVAGHSQGGGAALKAGNGTLMAESELTWVTTVVAMNPYGPSFVKTRGQNGQILVLGGAGDSVTPTDSYSEVLHDSILSNDQGGLQSEWEFGTHCNPACRNEFGIFGEISLLWWQIFLQGMDKCSELQGILNSGKWTTQTSSNFICSN